LKTKSSRSAPPKAASRKSPKAGSKQQKKGVRHGKGGVVAQGGRKKTAAVAQTEAVLGAEKTAEGSTCGDKDTAEAMSVDADPLAVRYCFLMIFFGLETNYNGTNLLL